MNFIKGFIAGLLLLTLTVFLMGAKNHSSATVIATDVAVAGTGTAYSEVIYNSVGSQNHGYYSRVSSSGDIDIVVTLQTSDNPNGGFVDVGSVATTNITSAYQGDNLPMVFSPFIRFKYVGQGTNDASTTITDYTIFNDRPNAF